MKAFGGKRSDVTTADEIDEVTWENRATRGRCLSITVGQEEKPREWAELCDGCYLLGTNLQGRYAMDLWETCIGLFQIEDSRFANEHNFSSCPIYP